MDRPSMIFASYVLLFVALDFPWVRVIDHAVPREGWMGDAGILVLVLGWVTHALATAPARLYELPINFPSRAQLTGSEHLLSAQLAFAPVYALTGNAVLGANVVALLSYPLAALSMERLLRALGCVAATAWIGGLHPLLHRLPSVRESRTSEPTRGPRLFPRVRHASTPSSSSRSGSRKRAQHRARRGPSWRGCRFVEICFPVRPFLSRSPSALPLREAMC
jgi:hypothetical protein